MEVIRQLTVVHVIQGAARNKPLTPKPEQSKGETTIHVLLLFLFMFCLFSFPFFFFFFGKDVSKQALLTKLPVN